MGTLPLFTMAEPLLSPIGLSLSTKARPGSVPHPDAKLMSGVHYCVFAHEAVRLLTAQGRPARRLTDGMLEWRLADLPVAT